MGAIQKPKTNPNTVLREEFDDWAVLFDPDSGDACGLNPVSVYIWKRLDGDHTVDDIVKDLRVDCDGVPEDAADYVGKFVDELIEKSLAEMKKSEEAKA